MKHRVILLGNGVGDLCFRIFLIWAAVGLFITGLNITILTIESWPIPEWLTVFFTGCLLWGDFIFNALAALVILILYSQWIGWGRSLAGLFLVGFCGAMAEWVGTKTGFPFGDYHYTGNMGPMIVGQLPWAIPLAWWSVGGAVGLAESRLPDFPDWPAPATALAADAEGEIYFQSFSPYDFDILLRARPLPVPTTGRAALVDPAFEVDRLLETASRRGWTVDTILLTHTHADHVAGLGRSLRREAL